MARVKRRNDRTKTSSLGKTWKLPLWVKVLVLGFLSCILAVLVLYIGVRSYVLGDGFANQLAVETGKVLGGNGEVSSLKWNGWDAEVEEFHLSDGKGSVKAATLEGLKADLRIGSVREEAWDFSGVKADKLELTLGARDQDYVPYQRQEPTGINAWLPNKLALKEFEVNSLNVHYLDKQGQFDFLETRVKAENLADGGIKALLFGGEIKLPWQFLPTVKHLDSKLIYEGSSLTISDGFFHVFDENSLELSAVLDFKTKKYRAEAKLDDVDVQHFLSQKWSKSLSGQASATVDYLSDKATVGVRAKGHLKLKNGVLSKLDILEKIARYTNSAGYRQLEFSRCSCDYVYTEDSLILKNIRIFSSGKVGVEGELTIFEDQRVDGNLMLGIPEGALSFVPVPGVETLVFKPGKKQMLWTPVKITGSLHHLEEDLSQRILGAAAQKILNIIPDTGAKLLNGEIPLAAGTELDKLPKVALNTGTELLSSILGSGDKPLSGKESWKFKSFGAEVLLAKKWKRNSDWNSSSTEPFASVQAGKKALAKAYVEQSKQPARVFSDEWKSTASGKLSKTKEFLTRSGKPAFMTTRVEGEKKCEVVGIVQFSDAVSIKYSYSGALKDKDTLERNLENMVMSIKAESTSLVPELPKVDESIIPIPIPNPFGL